MSSRAYRDLSEYASVRVVHLDLLELSSPGRQTMTVIGMDVQNGMGRPSDFCYPGLPSSSINNRVMDSLTYPGYSDPSLRHISEEESVDTYEALRESNRAAMRAKKIIEEEELQKARAARAQKLVEEEQKRKEKAYKKKVKKQRQRERKRCEKLEKEEPDTENSENGKVTDGSQQSKGVSKGVNGSLAKEDASSCKDQRTTSDSLDESLYYTASSDEDSDQGSDSSTSEELDMSSSFVSKAALIAKRKLEQKEKKKNPVKEEPQILKETPPPPKETPPPPREQSNEVQNNIEEKSLTIVGPGMGFKDNIQTSTEYAVLGNKYASSGQFDLAITYFTEAIKYNPKEYKLFGNRSFCFERMQAFGKSLTDAEVSLAMCPGWVKGLYRKGRALAGLKRYEEAATAFKEVLKLDSSCVDAAQELMRVQITQLMGYGFTREQSSNALIIHGTVDKALEVLSELHWRPGTIYNGNHPTPGPPLPPAQMKNITSFSTVPVAATKPSPPPPPPPQPKQEPKQSVNNKPLAPVHNKPNVQTRPNPNPVIKKDTVDDKQEPDVELFPVWAGNLEKCVTETMVKDLFSKAGFVHSVKVLSYRRCAFINYTDPKHCTEAMKMFHGYVLMGTNIVVRYPDRLSRGMGISKSALNADFLPDKECFFWRNVGCNRGATCRYKHIKENYRIDFGKKKPTP